MKVTTEVLVDPLSRIITKIGESISEAQRAMDDNSIKTQLEIENDEQLRESGLQATWYHMPEVEAEIKMSLQMKLKGERDSKGKIRAYRPVIHAAPLNASYKNNYNYDVSGSSSLKARFVSIPPPITIRSSEED